MDKKATDPQKTQDLESKAALLLEAVRQQWFNHGWAKLEEHIKEFDERSGGYDHTGAGRLPQSHEWRPYRFCSRDVILGAVVFRHSLQLNCIEVDVFLTIDTPDFEPGSGAEGLTVLLLSEAFKSGGSMELRFTPNVETGVVPEALRRLAHNFGCSLAHAKEGFVSPTEAVDLYIAITRFSPNLRKRIEDRSKQRRLSPERACYVVHRGVWTRNELEAIISETPTPERILSGGAEAEKRHLYLNDLFFARAAVLGGNLDRRLATTADLASNTDAVLEDAERELEVEYLDLVGGKKYISPGSDIVLPWLVTEPMQIPAGEDFFVLIRAWDQHQLANYLENEIKTVVKQLPPTKKRFVLVPADFSFLTNKEKRKLITAANNSSIRLMVAPYTIRMLENEAKGKLANSWLIRQC